MGCGGGELFLFSLHWGEKLLRCRKCGNKYLGTSSLLEKKDLLIIWGRKDTKRFSSSGD